MASGATDQDLLLFGEGGRGCSQKAQTPSFKGENRFVRLPPLKLFLYISSRADVRFQMSLKLMILTGVSDKLPILG